MRQSKVYLCCRIEWIGVVLPQRKRPGYRGLIVHRCWNPTDKLDCIDTDEVTAAARWLQVWFKQKLEVQPGVTPPDFTVMVGASSSIAWDHGYIISDEGTGFTIYAATTETGTTAPTLAMTGTIFLKLMWVIYHLLKLIRI